MKEEVLEAYMDLYEISKKDLDLKNVKECYFGIFSNKDAFVDYVLEEVKYVKIPYWVSIDYDKTWAKIMEDYHYHEKTNCYFWAFNRII
tara:strand:- start:142 stop:408 length:267 start_codon:yes stop_codon:yes gene_type:complete